MTPSVMARRLMNAQRSIVASIEAFGESLGINVIGPPNHRDPAVRALLLVEWIDARLKEIGAAIGVDMAVAPMLPEPESEPEAEPKPLEQDAESLETVELGLDGEMPDPEPEHESEPAPEPAVEPEQEPKTSRKRK
ncbi:MAG: hypothetical protein IT364_24555 [Candidatus Hydrogenedentes bacterium]|nr:hypothetical protein [Candidatus Hydrogenedentota bacterium]